jgi:hypothetical protein
MEEECSLPHLHELSICPYLEPDQSSPHQSITSLEDLSYYYAPTYVLGCLVVYFPLAFLLKTYTRSFSPYSCYIPRQSHHPLFDHSSSTWRRVQITKLFFMQFSPPSSYFDLLWSKNTRIFIYTFSLWRRRGHMSEPNLILPHADKLHCDAAKDLLVQSVSATPSHAWTIPSCVKWRFQTSPHSVVFLAAMAAFLLPVPLTHPPHHTSIRKQTCRHIFLIHNHQPPELKIQIPKNNYVS